MLIVRLKTLFKAWRLTITIRIITQVYLFIRSICISTQEKPYKISLVDSNRVPIVSNNNEFKRALEELKKQSLLYRIDEESGLTIVMVKNLKIAASGDDMKDAVRNLAKKWVEKNRILCS